MLPFFQVQKLLGICSEHLEKGETHQGPAVLGIALIAMAEELGADMAVRSLERLLQYGEQNIRRAVPLALGVLCISNPKVSLCELSALQLVLSCVWHLWIATDGGEQFWGAGGQQMNICIFALFRQMWID
jgi:hypothetical protein